MEVFGERGSAPEDVDKDVLDRFMNRKVVRHRHSRADRRFFMKPIAVLDYHQDALLHFRHGPGVRRQERRAAVGLG